MSTDSDRFARGVHRFLTSLDLTTPMPPGFEVMDPYADPEVRKIVKAFTAKYYAGDQARVPILGINPGRFGGGVTGLSFTDPYAVTEILGINSAVRGRRELSAEFVYKVIDAYGGAATFYRDFYLSALSPLGFLRDGKNINFYDDADFASKIRPQIVQWMRRQISLGLRTDACIVLGTGKLKDYVESRLRPDLPFGRIEYLEHPRFIMQYRRRKLTDFIDRYVDTLSRIKTQNS